MLSEPHASHPAFSEMNLPARHATHLVAPLNEVNPAAQIAQLSAPECEVNLPAAHDSMMCVPLHDEPAGHS